MASLVLDGQRVLPAKASSFGFRFRFENLEPALREILDRPSRR
jgi:NAD dependent epimerase/dehydratase family enzyme